MLAAVQGGQTHVALAQIYGISRQRVAQIVYKTWRARETQTSQGVAGPETIPSWPPA
jgi:DNA-directed RNA polymerase sigma subunit (sigma70/sigma32)